MLQPLGASLIRLQSDSGLKNKTRQGLWRAAYYDAAENRLDATALRWTATVVGNGSDVLNLGDLDTKIVQCTNR
jgi:hypothetical protein